ncbi:MarR family transcriptional regulator [Rhodobacteraceae bacterium F11138]|nr:MarR family transcriptional regulator [Rhodobacteraceae bacterium F11138]
MHDNGGSGGGLKQDAERLWRTDNTARLFLHAFNTFEEKLLLRAAAAGAGDIRRVHLNVLRHIDVKGTRMADLAQRAGITNGAMSQAVALCQRDGLVEIKTDPDDKRARRVYFTPDGLTLLETLHQLFLGIEQEISDIVGEDGFAELRRLLGLLQRDFNVSAGEIKARG